MTDLLAIGTRKGLWLARSDDDRRTWKVDGPHLLAQEVAAVGVDTRGDRPRVLAGIMYGHWGPSVMRSDDLGATWEETDHGAIRFPEDTGAALERVWQLRPDSADRPGVVWAGCEPHSLWRSTDGGSQLRAGPRALRPPAPADLAARRRGWRGAHRAARPGVRPGHDRHEHRRRLRQRGRRHEVGAAQPGHRRRVSCPSRRRSTGSACTRSRSTPRGPTGCTRRTTAGCTAPTTPAARWSSIAGGLPADFGFPIVSSPRTPGTAWVIPLVADMQRVPPDGRLRVHRTRDAGETWTELGGGALPDGAWTSVLRDAFCVDEGDPTGIYFGTRDGCVYASADEGETLHARGRPPARRPDRQGGEAAVSVEVVLPGSLADLAGGNKHVAGRRRRVGATLASVLDGLAEGRPLLDRRIRDETGQLRRFVNVYVDGDDVRFDNGVGTTVRDGAVVQVLPSVAGG